MAVTQKHELGCVLDNCSMLENDQQIDSFSLHTTLYGLPVRDLYIFALLHPTQQASLFFLSPLLTSYVNIISVLCLNYCWIKTRPLHKSVGFPTSAAHSGIFPSIKRDMCSFHLTLKCANK